MSTVFSDSFTVGSDTNINSYPSGTPDYSYNAGSGADLTVNAANDRVQKPNATATNMVARIINAAAPTGDQKITADCFVMNDSTNGGGQLATRCKSDGTQNFYLVKVNATDQTLRIYRCDAGSFTLLTSPSFTIIGNSLYPACTFQASGTGATVTLTAVFNGVTASNADTNANRKLAGTPGVSIWETATTNVAYIDNVIVDDLAVPGTPPIPDLVPFWAQMSPMLAQ